MNKTVVTLQVVRGPIAGRSFQYDSHDTFLFGRGKDCHSRLPNDGYVSRHHFLLEVNPPEVALRDLGSLNGTHVNGMRYGGQSETKGPVAGSSQTSLAHGDEIVVGNTHIRVTVDPPPQPPLTTPAANVDKGKAGVGPQRVYTPTRTENLERIAPVPTPFVPPAPVPVIPPQAPPLPVNPPGKVVAHGRTEPEVRPLKFALPATGEPSQPLVGGVEHLVRKAVQAHQAPAAPQIAGYDLQRQLGQGGMGTVYYAVRESDGFPVAVKILTSKAATSTDMQRRFLREIDILRSLQHQNICTLLDAAAIGNSFYFVADYCSGGSLADFARRQGGKVAYSILAPLLHQCLEGLEFAHRSGFVHRDIKPANLLLHQQGPGWTAKLGDFGLAKQFEHAGMSGMTVTGSFGGTHEFMPREQLTDFRGAKPVSDIWSLAATFYVLLTGAIPRPVPKGRDPIEVVLRDRCVPVRMVDPTVPPGFAKVIDQALDQEVEKRFSDASEMKTALAWALSQ